MIVVEGQGFSNDLTQYDDFVPGSLFKGEDLEPFTFTIKDFEVDWLTEGPRAGMARKFVSTLDYQETPDAEVKTYDLKVNHPLTIGSTEVFLIGHGYAPLITIRDGNGDVAYSGPTIFLPTDQTFQSFGVVRAPDALPGRDRAGGRVLPDVRARRRHAAVELRRPDQPAALDVRSTPATSGSTTARGSRSTCSTRPTPRR